MTQSSLLPAWRVIGGTVRGASHERSGTPNQDVFGTVTDTSGERPFTIIALSDGHGSAKCFRSDVGAELAVKSVISAISARIGHQDDLDGLPESSLASDICSAWDSAVATHLETNPFTADELETLLQKEGETALALIENDPSIAYGATVLATAVKGRSLLFLQLGDGDILCVNKYHETSLAFPRDERLIGNETTSLCTENADRCVRMKTIDWEEQSIEMVLMSSDGYSNSFRNEEDFTAIGRDYLQMIKRSGTAWVSERLPHFLEGTSQRGSGDDVTLAVLKFPSDTDVDALTERLSVLEREARSLAEQQRNSLRRFGLWLAGIGIATWLLIFWLISRQ